MDQQAAQSRADQVRTFRAALEILDSDDVLTLPEQAKARVRGYHDALLHAASERFDIDTSQTQKRLSWGMRIASFIGALALSAAVFFFYRFWRLLGLIAASLLLVLKSLRAATRESAT